MVSSCHFACNYEMMIEGFSGQLSPRVNSFDKLEQASDGANTEMAHVKLDQNVYNPEFHMISTETDTSRQTHTIRASSQLDQSLPNLHFGAGTPTACEFDSDMSPDLIALKTSGGTSVSGNILEFCHNDETKGAHAEDSADYTKCHTEIVSHCHVAKINKSCKFNLEVSMQLKFPQVSEASTLSASVEKPKSVSRRGPQLNKTRNQATKKAQLSKPLKKSI